MAEKLGPQVLWRIFYAVAGVTTLLIMVRVPKINNDMWDAINSSYEATSLRITSASLDKFTLSTNDTKLEYDLAISYTFPKETLDLSRCRMVRVRAFYGGQLPSNKPAYLADTSAQDGSVRIQGQAVTIPAGQWSAVEYQNQTANGVFAIKVVFYVTWIPYSVEPFGGYVMCSLMVPWSSSGSRFELTYCDESRLSVWPPQKF